MPLDTVLKTSTQQPVPLAKIIGKAMILGSMVYAIASCSLSSVYSTINFSKDQQTLQGGADALGAFLVVAIFWMISNILVMHASYGRTGGVAAFSANMLIISWVYLTYRHAFTISVRRHHLQQPTLRFWYYDDLPLVP